MFQHSNNMLQVIHDYQCSECSAINHYRTIHTKDYKTIIQCKNCGHEKITQVMTVSCVPKDTKPIVIRGIKETNKEIF